MKRLMLDYISLSDISMERGKFIEIVNKIEITSRFSSIREEVYISYQAGLLTIHALRHGDRKTYDLFVKQGVIDLTTIS